MSKKKSKLIIEEGSKSGYFMKRVFAFMIDWYFSSVLLNLLIRIILITTKLGTNDGSVISYNLETQLVLILSSIFIAFIYFVYIPFKSKNTGTVMMKLLRLEIVNLDDSKPSFKTLFIRFFLGCFLLQGSLYSSFNTIVQTISKSIGTRKLNQIDYIISISMILIVLYSIFISIKDKKYNQTIHDKISKTYVKEKR